MPVLFFPNPDALRLALASGLVPGTVTGVPGRAGRDDAGRVWIELDQLPPREVLASLGRFGVVALGAPGTPTRPVQCWAELLPLKKCAPGPGPVLFSVPDKQLAAFVARLRRLRGGPLGIRLLSEPHVGTAWVTAQAPPAATLLWTEEPDSPVRAFRQQAPGVWTARGWEHPLAAHLTVPPSCVLLCAPNSGATVHRDPVPAPADDEHQLRQGEIAPTERAPLPRVEICFRLRRGEPSGPESLWVLSPPELGAFGDFCRGADERLLRRFQIATLDGPGGERIVIRHTPNDGGPGLPLAVPGYQCDPRLPALFVPTGWALKPKARASEAGRELGLSADRLTWLEPTPEGEFTVNAVELTAFRSLCDQLEYLPPAATPLAADRVSAERFALAKFALRAEPIPEPELELIELVPEEPIALPDEPAGWMTKSVGRLVRWVRRARGPEPEPPNPKAPPPPGRKPAARASAHSARVEQKLSSADALLHGHDRAAHRHQLESRLLADFPRLEPDQRAARWAELAGVYGTTGQALDAAMCWVNAIWECPVPPPEWLDEWAAAEQRAAGKPGDRAADLERWLAEPGRPGAGRVVAALAACAGFHPHPPAGFAGDLPRVLAVLDQHFDDVPVRGAWLARLAVARAANGDVLGLARWRDRIVHRLHDRGPGLDLDEPSFLRFRGAATAERFKTAREWLTHMKDPILAWVQRHAGGARLEWTGLEAETEATAVYAQLMLAWGLGALGERARARDWAARARKALSRAGGPRADPAAHALLGDLFLNRIKDAHEGAAPKPTLPAELQERLDRLHEFARYSVDRLREHSRILHPLGRVSAYHGRDLKEFWGQDRLGERLAVLGSRPDPVYASDEARALLALVAAQPTTATVPRVVFALLESGAGLEPALQAALLEQVPSALDWLEAWVRAGRWTDAERPQRVARYQARIIGSALAVAPDGGSASAVLRHITRGAAAGPLLPAVTAAAPRALRAARKFGLLAEAEALMNVLDPARAEWPDEALTAEKVGLAVGWFAAGDEEAGIRILDAARKYLFELASPNLAARTDVALAYAEALGFAPAGIALGRLEELFQRLDRVTVSGSTNCYFTLQPLRLIDTVVRSVVTDEFTLGTAVRAWLDEDEFLIRRRVHRDMAAQIRESEG